MSSPLPPLRVTLVDAYEIAGLGLAAALRPFADQVRWVPLADAVDRGVPGLDVVLFEPIGLVDTQREQVQALAELHRVAPTVYTWRSPGRGVDGSGAGRAGVGSAPAVLSKRLGAEDLVRLLRGLAEDNRRHRGRPGAGGGVASYSAEQQVLDAYRLTAREAEILLLVAAGLSNQEIGNRLFLSVNSVKTYLRTGYRKIGVTRRTQVVAWAIDHGLAFGES